MSLWQVLVLALVQGFAELLPISSSAHVVVAEKLMGLEPSSPPLTLLLVLLHTGTMLAVIAYFWRDWRQIYFRSAAAFRQAARLVVLATFLTGVVAAALILPIERWLSVRHPGAQIEELFGRLDLIAAALAAAGLMIVLSSAVSARRGSRARLSAELTGGQAAAVGAVQGLCLPFRGFSRSGATISTALLLGADRRPAEVFSFALAVVLTPAVVVREGLRLAHVRTAASQSLGSEIGLGILGLVVAFLAGLLALRWLSRWLEHGRWWIFGVYCGAAAAAVATLHTHGY